MFGQPVKPNNLRVINTARTTEEINDAAKKGFYPLIKPVVPSPDIHNMVAVFQNKQTGEIQLSRDVRWSLDGGDYERVLDYHHYYPYSFPEPFAAYLVPLDIAEGERVWLSDVIEDIVSVFGNQGWHPRLEACEAIWANGDFTIQFDPDTDAGVLIG